MDLFSFFFAFYGLILGLAVAELLSGFAGFVRDRPLRTLELRTALLAALVFIDICATWLDAWRTLRNVTLNFESFWPPILIGTCFYLAAAVVFPRDPKEFSALGDYFDRRKRFVGTLMLAAEVLIGITFIGEYGEALQLRPATFWFWQVPYKIVLLAAWIALLLVRSRRGNLIVLWVLLALFTLPYWTNGAIPNWLHQHFDQPA